jgi:Rap1a immunity proteins
MAESGPDLVCVRQSSAALVLTAGRHSEIQRRRRYAGGTWMNFARRQILQIAGATVAVGIIGLVVSAAADEGPVTADELRSMCQALLITQNATAQPPTAEEVMIQKAASACMFYVAGIVNLILFPGVADSVQVCVPKDTTMDQLRLNIERMMREDSKELRDHSGAFAIVSALQKNYPCK